MLATVGASLESDEPSVVHGAVDQRGGHVLVAEHAPPAGELDVHDMGHAPGLVGIRYDLEQEPGALLVDRHVAELVDDQEPRPGDLPELRVEPVFPFRAAQHHKQPGRGEEPDRYRAHVREPAQRDREMGLAGADGPIEHEVLATVDEKSSVASCARPQSAGMCRFDQSYPSMSFAFGNPAALRSLARFDRSLDSISASSQPWIGNGALDGFLEDESLFGEFLRTPVSKGGVEPLVVGPPHVVVEVAPQLLDRGVVVPVHELLLQQPVRRFDHGVVVGVALARQRSFDVEHVERLVDPRVVELAAPVGVEHLDVRQREVERGERAQYQARVPGPPGGMADDAPVRQVDQQTHVRPVSADADIGKIARQMRVRGVAVEPAVQQVREPGLVGPRPVRFGPSARVRARHALFAHDVADASPGRGDTPSFPGRP